MATKQKIKYYDISKVLSTKAQYVMLLGQRSNGKSFQAKKTIIENAYKTDSKFVYLRRWQADIKITAIEKYFKDAKISKWTNGEFDGIKAWNGSIYFTRITENGKTEKVKEIGSYCALNEYERYKSWAFVDYDYILYEEFITDGIYLNEEPRLLQQFVSTVARNRQMTVILVGNTLTRICPYFNEWCLDGVLKQKQGTIEVYHFHVEDSVIDIAVEMCEKINAENKMFFGSASKQIVSGEWDTKDMPKLPKSKNEYEKVYEILIEYQKFRFVLELLIEPDRGGAICFVYPLTRNRNFVRKISDVFSDDPYVTSKLNLERRPEKLVSDCIRLGKICFSDNLTGTDFNNVMSKFRI
jgi:hypothetical protein